MDGKKRAKAGVAHYERWVTSNTRKGNSQEWVVLCGTNMAKRIYDGDQNVGTDTGKKVGEQTLVVNMGKYSGEAWLRLGFALASPWLKLWKAEETSAFAVMEVITWNRSLAPDALRIPPPGELGDAEMQQAVAYLKWKLKAGAFLETSEHLTNFQDAKRIYKNLKDQLIRSKRFLKALKDLKRKRKGEEFHWGVRPQGL